MISILRNVHEGACSPLRQVRRYFSEEFSLGLRIGNQSKIFRVLPEKNLFRILVLTFIFSLACSRIYLPVCQASRQSQPNKPKVSKEAVNEGRLTFMRRCHFCHGVKGEGDGPAATYLDPKPRNFKSGVFKLRSTASGALPTDEDLFYTIKKGIPGSAMPAFGSSKLGLSDSQLWQVIFYLQTLSDLWIDDEEFSKSSDPEDREDYRYNKVEKTPSPPLFTEELLQKGLKIYTKAKCHECHGKTGRGDGETAYELKDDWGDGIFPRNLHKGWRYKGERGVTGIFKTITTGMNGTPMPSFKKALSEEDRWALSFFVDSLRNDLKERRLLKVKHIGADIPLNLENPLWEEAEALDVRLSGQILTTPRWPMHSIDLVKVKALYSNRNISFLLLWDDRKKDTSLINPHSGGEHSVGNLPDGLALQFFSENRVKQQLPHFLGGSPDKNARIWFWEASNETANGRQATVKKFSSAGPKKTFIPIPEEGQKTASLSFYSDGRWTLLLTFALTNKVFSQAAGGYPLSFTLNVWDGSAGEYGLKKSISSWRRIQLIPPESKGASLYPLITFLLTFSLGYFLFLISSKKAEPPFIKRGSGYYKAV